MTKPRTYKPTPRIGTEVRYRGRRATVVGRTDDDPELGAAVRISMQIEHADGRITMQRPWVSVSEIEIPLQPFRAESTPPENPALTAHGANVLLNRRAKRLEAGRP